MTNGTSTAADAPPEKVDGLPADKCADAAKLRCPNEESLVAPISFSHKNQKVWLHAAF